MIASPRGHALVVGAGLSGLAAAWHLADAGYDVTVADGSSRPGGMIHTITTPHGIIERAAPAFVWNETTKRWFERLDLAPHFASPLSRRRYIFRNGRARRWPLGPVETTAAIARLARSKLTGGFSARPGESVADWGKRVAGGPATEWIIGPAMQGTYAAPSASLAAEVVFRAPPVRGRLSVAPRGGMSTFTDGLVERLRARGVTFRFNETLASLDPDVPTIVATDVAAAARLLSPHAPRLARALGEVVPTGLRAVSSFYASNVSDARGFGVLFPRRSGVEALGVVFAGDVFEGRTNLRLETWIYGTRGSTPLAEVHGQVAADRRVLTGRDDSAIWIDDAGDEWQIPVYGPAILAVEAALGDLPPWLALAGNYLGRLGVAKLLDVADEAAQRLIARATSPRARE